MSQLRTRLPQLVTLWAATALIDGVLYYFFLSQPFIRVFFTPFAAAVLVAAVVGTCRVMRPRTVVDRRHGERRHRWRRARHESDPGKP